MRVVLKAGAAQLLALLITALAWWGLAQTGTRIPLGLASLFQGILALLFSRLWGLPAWWLVIQFGFVPLALLLHQARIPTPWYLAGFVLLLLTFRGTLRDRVPLYLTNRRTAEVVAELLPQRAGYRFLDLGCGNGQLLAWLARQNPDAEFYGVESSPLPFLLAWWRLRGLSNCQLRFGNLWSEDLAQFDMVYAFLSPEPMPRLWRRTRARMRPGSLFISNSFEIPGIAPDQVREVGDRRNTHLLIWRIPPAAPAQAPRPGR
jgi:SAM-dependent methyltransferase